MGKGFKAYYKLCWLHLPGLSIRIAHYSDFSSGFGYWRSSGDRISNPSSQVRILGKLAYSSRDLVSRLASLEQDITLLKSALSATTLIPNLSLEKTQPTLSIKNYPSDGIHHQVESSRAREDQCTVAIPNPNFSWEKTQSGSLVLDHLLANQHRFSSN